MNGTAWHRLVDAHMGLAVSAARKRPRNGHAEDLEQEARLALCEVACGWTGSDERFPVEAAARINRRVVDVLRQSGQEKPWGARAQQDARCGRADAEKTYGGDGFKPWELYWACGGLAGADQTTTVPIVEGDATVEDPDEQLERHEEELEHAGRWRSLPAADRALLDHVVLSSGTRGVSLSKVAMQLGERRREVKARIESALARLVTPAERLDISDEVVLR